MTVLLWLLIIFAFILAFVGLIKPVIPSVLMLWVGFLIYQFAFNNGELSWIFYVSMIVLMVLMFISDFAMNKYFVNKYGGSKISEYVALIGVLVGCFVFPPFGIIIIPFVAVFAVELMQDFDVNKAFKASLGSIVAFLTSNIAKAIIMFIMIVCFFIDVFVI